VGVSGYVVLSCQLVLNHDHVTPKKTKFWIYLITILLRQEKIILHRRDEINQHVTLHYIALQQA